MNLSKTDITVVLDRSGSMESIAKAMKEGFDSFIREQRSQPGEAALTLVQFDDKSELVYKARPLQEVPALVLEPRWSTALLDAVGKAITETGERFRAMDEKDRPGKVVFVVITDGQENSSVEFKRKDVLDMVKRQREGYNWSFVFLGANQDSFEEASRIGIMRSATMNYQATPAGVAAAYAKMSASMTSYRASLSAQAMTLEDK